MMDDSLLPVKENVQPLALTPTAADICVGGRCLLRVQCFNLDSSVPNYGGRQQLRDIDCKIGRSARPRSKLPLKASCCLV